MSDYPAHLLIRGDARRLPIASGSVHCVVTSPPYYNLRDYGSASQIGLESTPDAFVAAMVTVFREVWRVLRDDGVVFLNIGDSYANDTKWGGSGSGPTTKNYTSGLGGYVGQKAKRNTGLKPKDRMFIPHRVAIALQADGWYARDEIIWHKRAPMPESVNDRTTKSHEIVFLLAKRERYFYDAEAIREVGCGRLDRSPGSRGRLGSQGWKSTPLNESDGRNARSVWTLSNTPCDLAHFATMPEGLAERCIKAGTSAYGCCPSCGSPWIRITERSTITREHPNDFVKRTGEAGTGNSCSNSVAGTSVKTLGWQPTCSCPAADPVACTVFDPFSGAGTTGLVANRLGRRYLGTDLSLDYLQMSRRRIADGLRPVSKLDGVKTVAPLPGQLDLFGEA